MDRLFKESGYSFDFSNCIAAYQTEDKTYYGLFFELLSIDEFNKLFPDCSAVIITN